MYEEKYNQQQKIYEAVKNGDLDTTIKQIETGVDLNFQYKYKETLLKIAVNINHLKIIDILLEAGALPIYHDESLLKKSLRYALFENNIIILEKLIKAGINVNQNFEDNETALMSAAYCGNIHVVKMLVDAKANVNALSNGEYFALWNAASQGWQAVYNYLSPLTSPKLRKEAEKILSKGLIYRQRINDKLTEDFIGATAMNRIDDVIQAIEKGVNIDAFGSDENTALCIAANWGYLSIVRVLVEAGANLELGRESDRETPLIAAAGNFALAKSSSGFPDMEKNLLEIISILLSAGANVNAQTTEGWNALIAAANSGSIESVKLLLSAGANINAKDNRGGTALSRAKQAGHTEIVQLLLNAGATED